MGENLEPRTQNPGYSYRNLLLWQKAQDLALEIIGVVSRLRWLHEACDELIRMLTAKIVQFERVEKSKSRRLSEERSPYTSSDCTAGRF